MTLVCNSTWIRHLWKGQWAWIFNSGICNVCFMDGAVITLMTLMTVENNQHFLIQTAAVILIVLLTNWVNMDMLRLFIVMSKLSKSWMCLFTLNPP